MYAARSFLPWTGRNLDHTGRQPRIRLFCFPYAGGGAGVFRAWQDDLPETIQVCPIQLPGRENRFREPPFARLENLVEALATALFPLFNMPFALFGHSMGALIAFELARTLRATGVVPTHLFVGAARPPHLHKTDAPIHLLEDKKFVDALRRRVNGIPEAVLRSPDLLQALLPTLRADLALCERYLYARGEPLDCPISALGGEQDQTIELQQLAGWRVHTRASFDLQRFPGNHFFIAEARTPVLRSIITALSKISARSGP